MENWAGDLEFGRKEHSRSDRTRMALSQQMTTLYENEQANNQEDTVC